MLPPFRRTESALFKSKLTFTRNAATGTSPLITAATADDTDFYWIGPGGIFTGKQPDISNFPSGDFSLHSLEWDKITALTFGNRNLTAFDYPAISDQLTNLEVLSLYSNASLNENITNWELKDTLKYFYVSDTDVTGDISDYTLPDPLRGFYVFGTGVTGDISGYTLPPLLVYFQAYNTGVSGDISGYTLPAVLREFYLYNTSISYGSSGALATATRDSATYRLDNCALTQTEVDQILSDCVASNTTNSTLNVGGTNASPTDGALNADYLALIDPALGWSVTITT